MSEQQDDDFDMGEWVKYIYDDMEMQEDRELVVYHVPKPHAAMAYIIRALANPGCKGAEQALEEIIAVRDERIANGYPWGKRPAGSFADS